MSSIRMKADRAIYARREQEGRIATLQTDLRGDANLKHKANWETKTDNLITKNIVSNRISQMRQRNEQMLEERRAKLA